MAEAKLDWKLPKRWLDVWSRSTTGMLEPWLEDESTLGRSGRWLDLVARTRQVTERVFELWWGGWGLPSRNTQLQILHRLNELESRLHDLDEHRPGQQR